MKKHLLLIVLTALLGTGCYAETELHPQPTYQHFRWCWSTFYHPVCFMTMDECEADVVAHETDVVTPCRRERFFTNER